MGWAAGGRTANGQRAQAGGVQGLNTWERCPAARLSGLACRRGLRVGPLQRRLDHPGVVHARLAEVAHILGDGGRGRGVHVALPIPCGRQGADSSWVRLPYYAAHSTQLLVKGKAMMWAKWAARSASS